MSVQVFEGNIELKKELLDGTPIRLDAIEKWEELSEQQKLWLSVFFDNFPNESVASLQTGFGQTIVTRWKKENIFASVKEFIADIHKDMLSKKHFDESYSDPKIRYQVLKHLKAKGYEPESKNNNTLNINTGMDMNSVIKALKETNS